MVRRRRRRVLCYAVCCCFYSFACHFAAYAFAQRINQTYFMEGSQCGGEATVSGASVYSHLRWSTGQPPAGPYSHNTDCTVVFRARRDGWRLLLRFDYVDIPDRAMNQQLCRDAVYVYDSNVVGVRAMKGAGGNGGLCGDTLPPAMASTGRYMTVYFRSDGGGRSGRGFKLTLTAFTDDNVCGEASFKCHDNKCIEDELVCDGIPHCADGSDEGNAVVTGEVSDLCRMSQHSNELPEITGHGSTTSVWDAFLELGIAACVGIVGGTLVVLVLLVICIVCTFKRCFKKDSDVLPGHPLANGSHGALLSPPVAVQQLAGGPPSYSSVPWTGVGQPPQSQSRYGVQGYFPLAAHSGGCFSSPQPPQNADVAFLPHGHRDSYSAPSVTYGTPKSIGGGSGSAFAQPMHTRPTGPGPRSYTPTTTLSSRSGGSSTTFQRSAVAATLSQL